MTLIERCICGATTGLAVERHGLPMLVCGCGVMRQQVDLTPEEYAAWYRERYFGEGIYYHSEAQDRHVARLRLDAYDLPAGARLLDVGAGNGAFVQEARARGIDAWGQDLATQSAGPHVRVGALADLVFPAAAFDVVTMHDVLEHVPEPRGFLREVARILKPGGRLIVDFPRFHHAAGVHHWKPTEHLWMLDEAQLAALLVSEGFAVGALRHPIESKVVAYSARPRTARVVYTAGVFDLLHRGHINLLWQSRQLGDVLTVGVVSDAGVTAYKGRSPVQSAAERMAAVAQLGFASVVLLQPTTDPTPLLERLRPDVMTHGDDWPRLREGHDTLERLGIEWRLVPYTPGISTTLLRTVEVA